MKTLSTKAIICLFLVIGALITCGGLASGFISFYNDEIELRESFTQKIDERTAFYDKMSKIFQQKTKIAVRNDSSFQHVVNTIITGQKDGENVTWKWIKQIDPSANYEQVQKLYADLSRTIEGQREGFFEQEKMLQDIVKQHSILIKKFPGSIYNMFFNRKILEYSPIQSTSTKQVFETGIDDNVDLGL